MEKTRIFAVVGIDDLEGMTFAQCTTMEKAKKAMKILVENGFDDVEIIESNLTLDVIEVEGKYYEL
jgi:hypothetical protein